MTCRSATMCWIIAQLCSTSFKPSRNFVLPLRYGISRLGSDGSSWADFVVQELAADASSPRDGHQHQTHCPACGTLFARFQHCPPCATPSHRDRKSTPILPVLRL